jgi:flagellin-like hook-associated protein FlgL
MAISLTASMRTAVYSLQDMNNSIDTANKRLATGRKVNSALDNAGSFFAAEGMRKNARDLTALLDSQNRGLQIIKKATDAVNNLSKLVESAQALARQARNLAPTDTQRDTIGTQVRTLLNQMDNTVRDARFDGANVLTAASLVGADLSVVTNTSQTANTQTKVVVGKQDVSINAATGLNLAIVANGYGYTAPTAGDTVNDGTNGATFTAGWTDAELDAFIAASQAALNRLQTVGSVIATNGSVLQLRLEFTKQSARIESEQADFLTLADMNEEGAQLTALQTRQQLAVQALSLAGRSEQAILRLF